MNVLIYEDYKHSHVTLYKSLCRHFGADAVGFCDMQDILRGCLDSTVDLFVMPGGADLYYVERLRGEANNEIRTYVENGGTYLGICAGAYYGCAYIEWARNEGDHAICGSRDLAFFPGIATGPVYEFIQDGNFKQSWQAAPRLLYNDGVNRKETCVYYHGGPVFSVQNIEDDDTRIKVLARYMDLPDQPGAIIECRVKKGKAILCSPHLEQAASDLKKQIYRFHNKSYDWEKDVMDNLSSYETSIRYIFSAILDRCLQPFEDHPYQDGGVESYEFHDEF